LSLPIKGIRLAPHPDSFHFIRAAPVISVRWFRVPPFLARRLAGFATADFGAEPLVMMIPGIGGEPFFAVVTFFAATFR